MFASITQNFYILTNGMSRSRLKLFNEALIRNHAKVTNDEELEKNKNLVANLIILFDEMSLTDWLLIKKIIFKKQFIGTDNLEKIKFVKTSWLSDCLKQKCFNDFDLYELKPIINSDATGKTDKQIQKQTNKRPSDELNFEEVKIKKIDNSFKILSNAGDQFNNVNESDNDSFKSANSSFEEIDENSDDDVKEMKATSSYTCSHSSLEHKNNLNKDIIDKLEELCSLYQSTQNKYRALGYQKAIASLKKHHKRITTWEVSCAKSTEFNKFYLNC